VGDKWASDEIIPAYVKISLKWNMNKVIFYSGYNNLNYQLRQKNKYYNRSRLSEAKFREVIKCFSVPPKLHN
jgi:hypothetical protein